MLTDILFDETVRAPSPDKRVYRDNRANRVKAGVSHPLAVQVVHSFGDGVKHSASLSLREELLPEDLIQQLAALHQLRHQIHEAALVVHLTHTHTHLSEPHTAAAAGHQSRVTHVLQRDDVGMLAVPHQDLDLLRRVALAFVNDLFKHQRKHDTSYNYAQHRWCSSTRNTVITETLIIIKNC